MTLLQKMDKVLECLYENSGKNPSMELIRKNLDPYLIEQGEIQDCLLHLYRRKQIYCEVNGNREAHYSDHDYAHYLISFEGKLFWETVGGYEKEFESTNVRKLWEDRFVEKSEANQERLNKLTFWLSIGTIGLFLFEIMKFIISVLAPHCVYQ